MSSCIYHISNNLCFFCIFCIGVNHIFLLFSALNEGFLLFLQAGTELSITDAFSNALLTVTTHSNRHEWSPRQFVNTGENFRSHLIDKWSVMDVQKVTHFLLLLEIIEPHHKQNGFILANSIHADQPFV